MEQDLETWLKENNISVAQAAKDIGYTRQRLYQIIRNCKNRSAGADLIRKLLKYTNNEVSVDSLLNPPVDTEGGSPYDT